MSSHFEILFTWMFHSLLSRIHQANWETEFQKWVGTTEKRNVPAIRFYPWNDQKSKMKIVKEWYDYGGILCVSLEKYASACKRFLDNGKRASKKAVTQRKSVNSAENEAFLRMVRLLLEIRC